jgi:hypothetical protein
MGAVSSKIGSDFKTGLMTLGAGGMLLVFLKAFSMGGGTYTGIEAVSNGLQILREPRAKTGKKTMVYMATSLAFTAGGILVCYLLLGVHPITGRTINAVLADGVFGKWAMGGGLAFITIFSEGALLIVGAQTGFVDGPGLWPTWPWITGFPTASPRFPTGFRSRTAFSSWAARRSAC